LTLDRDTVTDFFYLSGLHRFASRAIVRAASLVVAVGKRDLKLRAGGELLQFGD
jgi:hypothetical protein